MRPRLGLAIVLVFGPLAFAPAPFPKKARPGPEPEISLKSFQGAWRIVRIDETVRGRIIPTRVSVTGVSVKGDRWSFEPANYAGARLDLSIDHTRQPAQLTFHSVNDSQKKAYGVGLIRRRGGQVQILYAWGGEENRPRTFDPPPDGYYLMTLER
jgi:uncharacterized protein (TIGR03067 family)